MSQTVSNSPLEGTRTADASSLRVRSRSLDRIAVQMRGKTRVVPVEEVDFITASGPYAELHVGGDEYVMREFMQNVEGLLDSEQFIHIRRS
jgi:two-component system, LytTR family, response regulator